MIRKFYDNDLTNKFIDTVKKIGGGIYDMKTYKHYQHDVYEIHYSIPSFLIPEPMLPQPCICECQNKEFTYEPFVMSHGVIHLLRYCTKCGKENAYAVLKVSLKDSLNFQMPFGKYKGKTLEEIKIQDPSYLIWLKQNTENKNINRRIEKIINTDPDIKEVF